MHENDKERKEKNYFKIFEGKKVKLTKDDGFILIGVVDEVYKDGIIFSTSQKTSFISRTAIKEIIPLEGKNDNY